MQQLTLFLALTGASALNRPLIHRPALRMVSNQVRSPPGRRSLPFASRAEGIAAAHHPSLPDTPSNL